MVSFTLTRRGTEADKLRSWQLSALVDAVRPGAMMPPAMLPRVAGGVSYWVRAMGATPHGGVKAGAHRSHAPAQGAAPQAVPLCGGMFSHAPCG